MSYLSEFVYGGIDGIITTFSIIAGSEGGSLVRKVILILGISNVLSDGFSMGVSRYVSSKTEIQQGMLSGKNAVISSFVTFLSFVIIGMIPILPFLLLNKEIAKKTSLILALITFFSIGYIKGYIIKDSPLKNGLEVLSIGIIAALISYIVGHYVSKYEDKF